MRGDFAMQAGARCNEAIGILFEQFFIHSRPVIKSFNMSGRGQLH